MSNQKHDQIVEQLPGEERGMPSVNENGPSTAKRGLIVMGLLLVFCAAAGVGYWKYQSNTAKAKEGSAQKNLQLTSSVPTRTFVALPEDEAPALPGVAATPTEAVPVPVVGSAPPALPANYDNAPLAPNGKPIAPLDKSGSGLMAVASNAAVSGGNNGANAQHDGSSGSQSNGQLDGNGMAQMLSATQTPARKAGMLGDRNFILAKGSFIDCALQTRLDSTVPGMTACVITRNIYSDNGKVLLVERGSTVTGEYQSNMKQGMARIFVLWSRIKTPNGVVINLDSPGTDPLGGSGVPGYINNHFWKRFGGALMLSLVDDVARGITNNTGSNGNNQFNFNSTGDATQDMAAEALKNTINIPPTLYKNQGEQVGIYIARDLDFSSVYDVADQ